MIREADEERVRLTRERKDLARKHDDLVEVVATLRVELVASERKTRELEIETSSVSFCLLTLKLLMHLYFPS